MSTARELELDQMKYSFTLHFKATSIIFQNTNLRKSKELLLHIW